MVFYGYMFRGTGLYAEPPRGSLAAPYVPRPSHYQKTIQVRLCSIRGLYRRSFRLPSRAQVQYREKRRPYK